MSGSSTQRRSFGLIWCLAGARPHAAHRPTQGPDGVGGRGRGEGFMGQQDSRVVELIF